MNPIIRKTLFGLSMGYYIRQFLFGAVLMALFVFLITSKTGVTGDNIPQIIMMGISTILYPYSRFVYESMVDYVMGDNVFFVNAVLMLAVKLFTMVVCWSFAIIVAPIGLLILYIIHTKREKNDEIQNSEN